MSADTNINRISGQVNELYLLYFLSGENWGLVENGEELSRILSESSGCLQESDLDLRRSHARNQAKKTIEWLLTHPLYSYSQIRKLYWVEDPLGLPSHLPDHITNIDKKTNSSDIIVRFYTGQYLGISAKSAKTIGGKSKRGVGTKNLGLGTLERHFPNQDITEQLLVEKEKQFIEEHGLSPIKKIRKQQIRASERMISISDNTGSQILNSIADKFHEIYCSLDIQDLRDHILKVWLNAPVQEWTAEDFNSLDSVQVVKVEARKEGSCKLSDPFSGGSRIAQAVREAITLHISRTGNETLLVHADGQTILSMRFKFDSQKMAGSIKVSIEPLISDEKG